MLIIADQVERLDKFLARSLPEHSRSKLARLITEGLVFVDGQTAKPSFELQPGMEVTLDEPSDSSAHDLTPAEIHLDVVYEDDVLVVVGSWIWVALICLIRPRKKR